MNNLELTRSEAVEIGRDDLLAIVAKAAERYVEDHEPDSMATLAAVELIHRLEGDITDDRSCSELGYTRADFLELVRKKYLEVHAKEPNDESLKSVGQAVATQLARFHPMIPHHGRNWQTAFSGPTKAQRDGEGSDRYYLVIRIDPATDTGLRFDYLIGRCFCCGNTTEYDPNNRYCDNPECYGRFFPVSERHNLITILPERRVVSGHEPTRLPLEDSLVQFAVPDAAVNPISEPGVAQPFLPFEVDYLHDWGLTLGAPLVYAAPQLQSYSGFKRVYVLDMSPYRPSRTLKDPKSWAAINNAIHNNITHLVVYTAGNAAFSLARLAYESNRISGRAITVYAIVGNDVSDNVKMILSVAGCKMLSVPLPGGALPIVDRSDLWSYLHCHVDHTSDTTPLRDALDVTDGWDGFGVETYRSIFHKVFRRVCPDYVVVPTGTGNLLIGASLALSDVENASSGKKTRLVAAMPYGDNMRQACIEQKLPLDRRFRIVSEHDAMMPKLSGLYSPLIPCVSFLHRENRLQFIEVTGAMQLDIARWMIQLPHALRITSEPSALVGFAALAGSEEHPGLREYVNKERSPMQYRTLPAPESTVLVVNTGFGVLGDRDYQFLAKAKAAL